MKPWPQNAEWWQESGSVLLCNKYHEKMSLRKHERESESEIRRGVNINQNLLQIMLDFEIFMTRHLNSKWVMSRQTQSNWHFFIFLPPLIYSSGIMSLMSNARLCANKKRKNPLMWMKNDWMLNKINKNDLMNLKWWLAYNEKYCRLWTSLMLCCRQQKNALEGIKWILRERKRKSLVNEY